MTARNSRPLVAVFALLITAVCAVDARACTSCGTPAVSYYQPATYTAAYQPVAYQTYYATTANTNWYPGYWMDRWSARAATPTVYTAAYQPVYTASYATSYAPISSGCSSCSNYTASYSPCSSCNTVQQVTMMPVVSSGCGCDTCSSPCGCTASSGCSSCGSSGVAQASFVQSSVQPSSGCSSCGQSVQSSGTTFVPEPNTTAPIQSGQQQLEPTPAPGIPLNQSVPTERTEVKKPAESTVQPPPAAPASATPEQPVAPSESTGTGTEQNNSTFVAPPLLLFNPKDKTAHNPVRSAAPVTVAVYEKAVASGPAATKVSGKPITRQQAQQDAVGWTSASH